MLLVVLGHANLREDSVKYIYSFHMPLFFMISGMLHRPGKYHCYKEIIIDKAKKLLVPHITINMVMLIVWMLNFNIFWDQDPTLKELIKGIFYINDPVYLSPSNVTWFLVLMFLVEILFYACERFANGDLQKLILMVTLLGVAGFSNSMMNFKGPWHMEAALTSIVFYLIGYLISLHMEDLKQFSSKVNYYYLSIPILLVLGWYFQHKNHRVSFNGNNYGSILYFYIAALCTCFALLLVVMKLPYSKLLTFIGQNTIVYVGFHLPLMHVLENAYPKLHGNPDYALLLGIFVYIIMIPIAFIIDKYLPFIVGKNIWKKKA